MTPPGAARIAYLVEYPTVSGGEQSLLTLLGHLDRDRFRPVVLGPGSGPLADELRKVCVPLVPDPGSEEARARCLREAGIDLVHANSLSMGCRSGPLSVCTGLPAVSHVRDIMRLGGIRKTALLQNRALIAVSRATALALTEQGIPADCVHVIPNGIEVLVHDRKKAGEALRNELGFAGECPVVGCVGQICLRKGQDVFLKAAARVAVEIPEVRFVVVGKRFSTKAESREYEEALHATANRPPLRGRVHFLGWREDALALMAGLSILAHASHQEPLGRVLLEALAAGTPVVATRVGGTPEIIEHEKTGLLVPKGDDRALAEEILRILRIEPLLRHMAAVGREHVVRNYNPHEMVSAIQSQYEGLLGSQ